MDKVVLITGGSRGIGAATARLAAQRGYAVCVNYRREPRRGRGGRRRCSDRARRAVARRRGRRVEADVVRLFETCDARARASVPALVNNAGVLETQMRVEAMDAARLQRCWPPT